MRQYKLIEAGCHYDTIDAEDVDDALETARENLDASVYDRDAGTVWIRLYAINIDDDDDNGSVDVTCHPDEPDCIDGETHNWQSPIELVGGIQENPGVRGHGGGVVIDECCVRCGCRRQTDTWAQNPDTGEQGLESIRYDVGYYDLPDPELAWVSPEGLLYLWHGGTIVNMYDESGDNVDCFSLSQACKDEGFHAVLSACHDVHDEREREASE